MTPVNNPNQDGGIVLDVAAVCDRRYRRNFETLPLPKLNMKMILLFTCVITLLTTTGCLVSEGGRHGHARYKSHSEVIVGPPAVEVRVPVVEVRPPEIIVR